MPEIQANALDMARCPNGELGRCYINQIQMQNILKYQMLSSDVLSIVSCFLQNFVLLEWQSVNILL